MQPSLNDLDEMIVTEKLRAAMEYQNEAWADGRADGIEPEIIADAAFVFAIQETIRTIGEAGTEAMLKSLIGRMQVGEFTADRTIQ